MEWIKNMWRITVSSGNGKCIPFDKRIERSWFIWKWWSIQVNMELEMRIFSRNCWLFDDNIFYHFISNYVYCPSINDETKRVYFIYNRSKLNVDIFFSPVFIFGGLYFTQLESISNGFVNQGKLMSHNSICIHTKTH